MRNCVYNFINIFPTRDALNSGEDNFRMQILMNFDYFDANLCISRNVARHGSERSALCVKVQKTFSPKNQSIVVIKRLTVISVLFSIMVTIIFAIFAALVSCMETFWLHKG